MKDIRKGGRINGPAARRQLCDWNEPPRNSQNTVVLRVEEGYKDKDQENLGGQKDVKRRERGELQAGRRVSPRIPHLMEGGIHRLWLRQYDIIFLLRECPRAFPPTSLEELKRRGAESRWRNATITHQRPKRLRVKPAAKISLLSVLRL